MSKPYTQEQTAAIQTMQIGENIYKYERLYSSRGWKDYRKNFNIMLNNNTALGLAGDYIVAKNTNIHRGKDTHKRRVRGTYNNTTPLKSIVRPDQWGEFVISIDEYGADKSAITVLNNQFEYWINTPKEFDVIEGDNYLVMVEPVVGDEYNYERLKVIEHIPTEYLEDVVERWDVDEDWDEDKPTDLEVMIRSKESNNIAKIHNELQGQSITVDNKTYSTIVEILGTYIRLVHLVIDGRITGTVQETIDAATGELLSSKYRRITVKRSK